MADSAPPGETGPVLQFDWVAPLPAPPKARFQHRYWVHILWFVLTLATATYAGISHYVGFHANFGPIDPDEIFTVANVLGGLWYAVPILAILAAHEFGHYAYCRIHDVDATLPYFIPAPLPLTGTMGAVIRIREAFPSRRALFGIGVAGPIGGFLLLVPCLIVGLAMSNVVRLPAESDSLWTLGEPLLFKGLAWMFFGTVPDGYSINLHPMAFAAWFGMLATALNLMPFGQLDGGHIVYALVGRRSTFVSAATLLITLLL